MAASRPTRPLLQKIRVIDISNENVSGYFLLLEMALQTQRRVTFGQQSLVDRSVGCMADGASLTHRLVLVDKRATLLRVTLETGFVSGQERKSTGFKPLLNICRGTLSRDPSMRFVAIAAAHLALEHRMVMWQCERCANFQVTLETGVRRLAWIYDGTRSAASFDVQTPRTVARLATHVLCVFPFRLQSRVSGCPEVAHDLFVAGRAFF